MAIKKYFVTVDEHSTRWYKDAKCKVLHRDEGPAIEWPGGKAWFQNGRRHRTGGPATVYSDGIETWCKDGTIHRDDGPAVVYPDGTQEWWINGKAMTEAEFLAATQPVVEMTVADIEKLLGKRVKIIK